MAHGNEQKLGELILYVAKKSESDPRFGKTKLNKLLFFADFYAYGATGQAITGVPYWRLPLGPGPQNLLAVLARLARDSDIEERVRYHQGIPQDRTVALREPDLSLFSASELHVVDRVIEKCRPMSAAYISEVSHQFPGWEYAKDYEVIPYDTVYLSFRRVTGAETEGIAGIMAHLAAGRPNAA